jgi:cobalamin biosynthesis protein CobT
MDKENQNQAGSDSENKNENQNQNSGNESSNNGDQSQGSNNDKNQSGNSNGEKGNDTKKNEANDQKNNDDESDESGDPKLAKDFEALKGVVSGQQKKLNDMSKELQTAKVKEAIFESEYPDFIKAELKNNSTNLTLEDVKVQGDRLLSIYEQGKKDGQGNVNRMINNRPDKSEDKEFEKKAVESIQGAKTLEDIQKAIKENS